MSNSCSCIAAIFQDHAVPGVDYEFQGITLAAPEFRFTIAPGASETFELLVIDDTVAEFYRKRIGLESGVYESGRPRVTDREEIYISDNDGI